MTTSTPLVSVVIPAYNAATTIRDTVQSALSQTFASIEVLVVDDGSRDNTIAVVNGIADPRVRLIVQPNGGAAAARNTGIEASEGRWVAFLDADDLWVPHKLRAQLDALEMVTDAFASQSSAYLVDDQMRILDTRRCIQPENDLLTFLRFQNLPAAASSWIVRRDVLEAIGGFDTSLGILEDWDLSIKLARFGRPLNLEEPLTLYRQHPGNRSLNLDIHIDPGLRVLDRVFSDPGLPQEIRDHEREIHARFYTMLCGGAFRVHRWRACVYWGGRALLKHPQMFGYMAALPFRHAQRWFGAHRRSPTDGA